MTLVVIFMLIVLVVVILMLIVVARMVIVTIVIRLIVIIILPHWWRERRGAQAGVQRITNTWHSAKRPPLFARSCVITCRTTLKTTKSCPAEYADIFWARGGQAGYSGLRIASRKNICVAWLQNMSAYSAAPKRRDSKRNGVASRKTEVFVASAMYS